MTGKLELPDFARPCGPYAPYYIAEDSVLCRVYNTASGFSCTSWNPSQPTGSDGGRFDATAADPFSYLYVAEGYDPNVAIIETLRPYFTYDSSRKRTIVSSKETDVRAVQWFSCSQGVTLASLADTRAQTAMNAPEEVTYVHDRPKTREWCRYFRSIALDAGGLAYNSTQFGMASELHSVIFWKDRVPNLKFVPSGAEVRFSTAAGRRLLQTALDPFGVLIV